VITYGATLDVPAETVRVVSCWLLAHRKAHDARPWQRAATPYAQAIMVLRWFKEATDLRVLARDAGVSIATAYRYLHEAIDVVAAQAPELPDVLAEGLRKGSAFVCLDGTLIASTRSSAPSEAGHDRWYSGKQKRHGGNIQVLTGPTGYPEWVSEVEPGSTHDITAARGHAFPALVILRVAEVELGDTWRNIRDELDRLHLVTLRTANGTLAQRSELTARHKEILHRLRLPDPARFYDFTPLTNRPDPGR
jgi:hypothetical protein